jgi:hypothetical protein
MKGSAFGCCPSFFIQQVFAAHSRFLCRQFTAATMALSMLTVPASGHGQIDSKQNATSVEPRRMLRMTSLNGSPDNLAEASSCR